MIIYLSHPIGPHYHRATERVRAIARGLATIHPCVAEYRYPHGRLPHGLPPHQVDPATITALRSRLICGEEATGTTYSFGPHPSGRLPPTPPATAVWIVGEGASEDLYLANRAEVPCYPLSDDEIDRVLRLAQPVRQESPADDAPRPMFRSPREVVHAYFRGMEPVVGVAAIDYARAKGDGNAHGVMERIGRATARIAAAASIFTAAGLDPVTAPPGCRLRVRRTAELLRLVIVEGQSQEAAARRVHLSQRHVGRLVAQAMQDIARVSYGHFYI